MQSGATAQRMEEPDNRVGEVPIRSQGHDYTFGLLRKISYCVVVVVFSASERLFRLGLQVILPLRL